jgi:hypothetical protein
MMVIMKLLSQGIGAYNNIIAEKRLFFTVILGGVLC